MSGEPEAPDPFGTFPLVVLLVLVVGGVLLIVELRDMSRVQDCAWSGRKNCVTVDPGR
jgi:hypothetical protein